MFLLKDVQEREDFLERKKKKSKAIKTVNLIPFFQAILKYVLSRSFHYQNLLILHHIFRF